MTRGGKKGQPRAQPQLLEEEEQPPGNSPITIDWNNPELPPWAEAERNETVESRSENTPRAFSSYSPMVDPNEGTTLDFVPLSEINGHKCAKIVGEDIEEEIAYWMYLLDRGLFMNGCHSNVITARCLGTRRTHVGRRNSTRKNGGLKTAHHLLKILSSPKLTYKAPHSKQQMLKKEWTMIFREGMNGPTKQEDLKIFLSQQQAGLIGFIETKVQLQKVDHHPSKYCFKTLQKSDQLIHGEVIHYSTSKKFHLTYVYGRNLEEQRQPLWDALKSITSIVDDAPWSVQGDFNAMLHSGDRIGGVEVTEGEITDYADCLLQCGLHEFHHTGAFFTWANKTIWSRIDRAFYNDFWHDSFDFTHVRYLADRAFYNDFWHDSFDFTHVRYLARGLFDHSPIALSFPSCPKPKSSFQLCDVWAKDESFKTIILSSMQQQQSHTCLGALKALLCKMRHPLKQLNRSRFADIYTQQAKAREELTIIQAQLHQDPANGDRIQKEIKCKDQHYSICNLSSKQVKAKFRVYPERDYRVNEGYQWLLQTTAKPSSTNLIWTRTSLPRHSFTAWMFMHQRLLVLSRVGRYTKLQSMECSFCHQKEETQEHLFFECRYAVAIWDGFQKEWGIKLELTGMEPYLKSLTKLKQSRKIRGVIYALFNAVTYNIWKAKNHSVFKNRTLPPQQILHEVRDHITRRILHLHHYKHNYNTCIDFILNGQMRLGSS
ncbi:hypothetical protein Cgig2_020990 [Carnegiea gigantea]|uniref:Reverse transcriptase zinc-binding domain-containing protein n=1 Tax=Carnegiea gigantea TaxID=171969 RepID=A0A9Q1KAY1_9CARY|nr:hypothetical protein Cgig2_020990 [Carnegiea gigantea]